MPAKPILLSTLLILPIASSAQTLSYSVFGSPDPVSRQVPVSDTNPGVISLPTFDSSLGTLLSVKITLTGWETAQIAIENNTDSTVTAEADLGALIRLGVDYDDDGNLAVSERTLLLALSYASPTTVLAPSDNGGVSNGSGDDYYDYGLFTVPSETDETLLTSDLSKFDGDGVSTWNALMTASGGFTISGASNATATISNYMAFGSAQATYTYEAIPEPRSAALGLAGMLGLLIRRRR